MFVSLEQILEIREELGRHVDISIGLSPEGLAIKVEGMVAPTGKPFCAMEVIPAASLENNCRQSQTVAIARLIRAAIKMREPDRFK